MNILRFFFQSVEAEAKLLPDKPSLTRQRKLPARFTDCLPTPARYKTVHDLYHHQYFEVIEKVINLLESRFKQSVFLLLCKVEQFILSAANGTKSSDDDVNLNDIREFLVGDLDIERLEREL